MESNFSSFKADQLLFNHLKNPKSLNTTFKQGGQGYATLGSAVSKDLQ